MNWQGLPVEIQTIIFQHLKPSQVQLNQCQLTCKGWFVTAQRELYTNVHVKRSKLDTFAQSVSNESVSHRNYVNTIHLDGFVKSEQSDHETANLLKIAKYCPNAERVMMISPKSAALLRKSLNQVGFAGLWNRIKELPPDHIEVLDQYPSYCQIVPLFTKSLETIRFAMNAHHRNRSTDIVKKLTVQKLDNIAHYLQHFHHIKKVTILLDRPLINLQFMDDFFNKVPATVNDIRFESVTDGGSSLGEDRNMDMILPIKKSDHLKSFQATLPTLNGNTVEYVLAKFPQLSSLTLIRAVRSFSYNTRPIDMPKTVLNQIMELNVFELKNLALTDHSVVFDTLIKERNTVKELTLTRYIDISLVQVKFYLDIEKYIKNGVTVTSISAKSNQANREVLPQNIEMFWEMELLEKYGAFLETLTIRNLTNGKNWNETCMVNSLTQKCPYLKTLVFVGLDLYHMAEVMKLRGRLPCVQNFSVETLVLNNQLIPESISNHLSRQYPSLSKVIMVIKTNGLLSKFPVRDGLEFDRYLNRKKETWIIMPHSRLDSVHLKYEVELEVHQNRLLFIRLDVNDRIRYFYCLERFTPKVNTLFNECTKKVLGDCLSKTWYRKVAYCSIKCMSLKQLVIESNSYQRSYNF